MSIKFNILLNLASTIVKKTCPDECILLNDKLYDTTDPCILVSSDDKHVNLLVLTDDFSRRIYDDFNIGSYTKKFVEHSWVHYNNRIYVTKYGDRSVKNSSFTMYYYLSEYVIIEAESYDDLIIKLSNIRDYINLNIC